MKIFIMLVLLLIISGGIMAQENGKNVIELKNRFNTEQSYVHFHFDYDSLRIDTIKVPNNPSFKVVHYTGYINEVDSFRSDNTWIKFIDPTERFFIIEEEGQLVYMHERFKDKTGVSFVKYEYHPELDMKIYESFSEKAGIQIRKKGNETYVNIDGTEIVLTPNEDVSRFYHINDEQAVEELNQFCGISKQTYYPNRALKESYSVNGNGLMTGRYALYSESGVLMESGNYSLSDNKSVQHGVWMYYDIAGIPTKVIRYELGVVKSVSKVKTNLKG